MKNYKTRIRRRHKARALKRCARISMIKSMTAIAVILLFAYPLMGKAISDGGGYYNVELNGEYLGAVRMPEEAEDALRSARHTVVKEAGSLVYMEPELVITQSERWFGTRMSIAKMEEKMYDALQECAELPKQTAYAVKVGEHILYLASEQEVLAVLDGVKNRIDLKQEFTVELVEKARAATGSLTTQIVKPGVEVYNTGTVFAAQDAMETMAGGEQLTPIFVDGMLSVEFEQNVEIIEAYVQREQLFSVQEALDFLTKDKEEPQVYEIISGDCMSMIAEKNELSLSRLYDLNPGVTGETVLQIGQELTITVPEPALSVLAKEEVTYEENYQVDTVYIDNDSWYRTEQVVRQEGSEGYHEVIALISTRNGKEVGRDIIKETIMIESFPKIVERGTKTPPTYAWPTYGGRITSYYGQRWGRLHAGLDFGVSTGSTIMASSGGYVVSAGWNGGYGYCILIKHPDGKQTRYAHLSKILVSTGQYVSQGEKIALSGNTGNSTGPHLHFEIIVNGSAVNPLNYLN